MDPGRASHCHESLLQTSFPESIADADWKTQLTETLPSEFHGILRGIKGIETEFA